MCRLTAAFAEAGRVLSPGGYFGFTVWASPEHSPGARIFEQAVQAHADPNVVLSSGTEYFGYGKAENYRKTLGQSGFDPASLDFRTVTVDWRVPSAAFVFQAERDAGVRMAAVLAAQKPEIQTAIQNQIAKELQPYAIGNGLCIPNAAHVIAARVAC